MAHRLCIVWLTRSCSPCGTLARLLADANAVDIVVSAHKFARVEALLSWGRASPPAYCPNMKIQFVDNTFTEGNHMWNWNATYPYPHPKTAEPYLIGVLGSDQDVQPCMPYPHAWGLRFMIPTLIPPSPIRPGRRRTKDRSTTLRSSSGTASCTVLRRLLGDHFPCLLVVGPFGG